MLMIWKSLLKNHKKFYTSVGAFAQSAFSSLLLFYLILFILENLFPGFVSSSFDLNIMLILLLFAGVLSAFFPTPPALSQPTTKKDYLLIALLTGLTFIIVLSKTKDLGNISLALSAVSSLLVLLISVSVLFVDRVAVAKQLALPIIYPKSWWTKIFVGVVEWIKLQLKFPVISKAFFNLVGRWKSHGFRVKHTMTTYFKRFGITYKVRTKKAFAYSRIYWAIFRLLLIEVRKQSIGYIQKLSRQFINRITNLTQSFHLKDFSNRVGRLLASMSRRSGPRPAMAGLAMTWLRSSFFTNFKLPVIPILIKSREESSKVGIKLSLYKTSAWKNLSLYPLRRLNEASRIRTGIALRLRLRTLRMTVEEKWKVLQIKMTSLLTMTVRLMKDKTNRKNILLYKVIILQNLRYVYKNKIILILILFFILRLIPYLNNGIPTGYDGGIYIHVIKFFPHTPAWLISQYYSFLFFFTYPFKLIGINPQIFIVPFAILLQIFLLYSVYWIVNKISGKQNAVFTAFILAISAIQMRTYWFFYLKYILSLIFFLYYLYFQGKKSYIRASFFGILVAITHLLTFSILIPVALIDTAISKYNRLGKGITFISILLIGVLFYLPHFYQTIISNFIPSANNLISLNFIQKDSGGGTFYPIYISILLTAVYLPLAIYGMFKITKAKREQLRPFLITFLLTLFLIIIKVSFFRRVFIITDLMLIVYASFGFSLIKDIKKFYIAILILFAIIFTFKTSDKLITEQNLQEISSLKISNNSYILSTAKEDTAWLLGYTNANIIAWDFGGFDKYWNTNQWMEFFNKNIPVKEKVSLLNLLPSQTIIYIDDNTKKNLNDLINSGFLISISQHFYRIKI